MVLSGAANSGKNASACPLGIRIFFLPWYSGEGSRWGLHSDGRTPTQTLPRSTGEGNSLRCQIVLRGGYCGADPAGLVAGAAGGAAPEASGLGSNSGCVAAGIPRGWVEAPAWFWSIC